MALILIRKMFFVNSSPAPYTLLPTSGHHDDARDTSFDSELSNRTLEKHIFQDVSNSRSRVDPRLISDMTIGLSDGLTVPFALTAGLSALGDTNLVIYGGLAELVAGAISMGLGGYLGAASEAYILSHSPSYSGS